MTKSQKPQRIEVMKQTNLAASATADGDCEALEHGEQSDDPAVKERVGAGVRLLRKVAHLRSENAGESRPEQDAEKPGSGTFSPDQPAQAHPIAREVENG